MSIQRDAFGVTELNFRRDSRTRTTRLALASDGLNLTVHGIDASDALIALIEDVEVAPLVYSQISWEIELSLCGRTAITSEAGDTDARVRRNDAAWSDAPYPMMAAFANIYVAVASNSHTTRKEQ